MYRTSLLMLTLLIVLTPAAASQTGKSQAKKPAQASTPPETTAIATADHEVGGVEVALVEVKRTPGGALTIRFRYTNKTSETKALAHGGDGLWAWRFSDVSIADPSTNQEYKVLKDQTGYPVAAKHEQFGSGIRLAPKQVVNTWVKVKAPPADVETITVTLPGAPPFEGVAIAK